MSELLLGRGRMGAGDAASRRAGSYLSFGVRARLVRRPRPASARSRSSRSSGTLPGRGGGRALGARRPRERLRRACRGRSTCRATRVLASRRRGRGRDLRRRAASSASSRCSCRPRTSRSRCAAPETRRGRSTTSSSRSSRPSACSSSRCSRRPATGRATRRTSTTRTTRRARSCSRRPTTSGPPRPEAFAVQRLYSPRHGLDVTETVRDGDLMLVPYGYHTTAAAHGYDLYYLNALAGDRRSMAVRRRSRPALDPRGLGRARARSPRPARPVIRAAIG